MRMVVVGVGLMLAGCPAFTSSDTSDATDSNTDTTDSTTSASSSTTDLEPSTSAVASTSGSSSSGSTTADPTNDDNDDDNDESTGTPPLRSCGDRLEQTGETCDDGNDDELDGCTSQCRVGPIALEFGAPTPTPLGGGSAQPTDNNTDTCAAGGVLVGLSGSLTSDGWIGVVQGVCRSSALTNTDPALFETLDDATSLPPHGDFDGGGPWSTECGEDEAIVAIRGQGGTVMDGLRVLCARVDTVGSPGDHTLSVEVNGRWEPQQGGNGGNPFGPISCPDGMVATGLRAQTSSYVNQLGLLCRSVALTYPRP